MGSYVGRDLVLVQHTLDVHWAFVPAEGNVVICPYVENMGGHVDGEILRDVWTDSPQDSLALAHI